MKIIHLARENGELRKLLDESAALRAEAARREAAALALQRWARRGAGYAFVRRLRAINAELVEKFALLEVARPIYEPACLVLQRAFRVKIARDRAERVRASASRAHENAKLAAASKAVEA